MSDRIVPSEALPGLRVVPRGAAGFVHRLARGAVLSRLRGLREGFLELRDGDEVLALGVQGSGLAARITVRDPAFWSDVALGGSIGAAEAYMADFWEADDLVSVVRLVVRNANVLTGVEGGLARLTMPLHRLLQAARRNTRGGSRRNIAAHYDLGNDFYALFLDETLTYSCALFERDDMTLAEASTAKYDRLCRKLDLRPGDRVLEIGTGWGGFALHAAGRYGCRVTTTTISREQHELASRRVQEAGLADRVEVLLCDYRDLTGTFDKLVSIEMIEAVGHHYLDAYFRCVGERLAPHGLAALQAITIVDHAYEQQLRSADFIKRYVFPGSFLPSVAAISASVARTTDLRLVHLEDLTPHYARTLAAWRQRFLARANDVRRLGFPESFLRLWEYYLCYCEGAFRERYIGDAQLLFAKPRCERAPILPALAA
ncbi:MAG: class I SAM-dependent methyltransferase [Deltaproteobacteria bacterium]|nr:class I SAM-dependent methyltransferase [Deltaproteobacteria bacterium]